MVDLDDIDKNFHPLLDAAVADVKRAFPDSVTDAQGITATNIWLSHLNAKVERANASLDNIVLLLKFLAFWTFVAMFKLEIHDFWTAWNWPWW